jgi:hypothetical protein
MKTNYTKHRFKAKKIERRIEEIKSKYPDFDFMDAEMRWDLQEYWKILNDLIYANVDADMCKHENKCLMCHDCTCYKSKKW